MAKHRRGRRGKRKTNWFAGLSKGKKIGVCVGGFILCLAAAGVIYAAFALSKIDTQDIAADDIVMNQEAELVGEGYTNVALFGIDSRTGELEKGTRTDCLIVASLNNETKEVKMISVYRDTVLDIKDNYLQKCNAAYAFGGPTQAINMINKNLDLNIQDYATVDFAAISETIDLLGGIEIDVKQEEIKPLNKFVGETAKVAGKKAKKVTEPGLQLLNGVQATTYARIRSTAGGDFTRTERQRLVIEKIVEKAQKTDIATINKIINEIFPTIKTSFSAAEILSYAKDFMKYDIAGSEGFPFDKTTATISGLGSIVIPVTLADNVKQLHEFLFGTTDYQVSSTVNTISNAVVARVGQREATDYSTLSQQTYTDTAEDKAQEHNQYSEPPKQQTTTGNNTGSSNNSNNNSGGSSSGGNNNGGNSSGGNGSGGSSSGGNSTGNSTPDAGGNNTGGSTPDTGGNNTGGSTPDAGGSTGGGDTGGGNTGGGNTGGDAGGGNTGSGDAGGGSTEPPAPEESAE